MQYQQHYHGVIWTNHAIDRMRGRGLSQEWAYESFAHADTTLKGKESGTLEYVKRYNQYQVTVIAKQNEKREWIIISAWIDPPMPGSIDTGKKEAYKKYQNASFWGKLLMTLRKQIGM